MRWIAALLLVPLLAGCLSDDGTDGDFGTPSWNGHAVDAPLESWLHDLSERIDDIATVTEQFRTSVPGPGGLPTVELDTWVIRPEGDGPFPLVLEVTPYYGGGEPAGLGRVGDELLGRGYAVGVSSVRGTGNSGGCFTQGGPQEAQDTATVIEDLAAKPWSNGRVGLMGVSYPGTTPQDVWVEAPPSLKTIVPISGISDLYKYNFVNGVPINIQGLAFNAYYWALVGASPAGLSGGAQVFGSPDHLVTAAAGELCPEQVVVQEGGATSAVDGNKDAYWQVRDFAAEYWADDRDVERASVFYIHGLQDWNVKPHNMEDWLDVYEDSGVPYKVWLGQWGHAWPASTGTSEQALCHYHGETGRGESCRDDWWNTTLVAWFDQFLKGIDTGILDAPPVQVQDDDGVWRHEAVWPPKDPETVTFYLDGTALTAAGPGSGTATFDSGTAAGNSGEPTRVRFISEPLEEDLAVSGLPRFTATVTPTAERANLIFSLGEEDEGGTVRWINHGALSLNHADGLESGALSVAGQDIDATVRLFPQDDVLHAGHRVILDFGPNTAGGPGPSLIPVADDGTITIDLATAMLELPVDRTVHPETPQPYVGPRPPAEPSDEECILGVVCP